MYEKSYSTTRGMRAIKTRTSEQFRTPCLVDTVIGAFEESDTETEDDSPNLRPPFQFEELIRIALVQPNGVLELTEEEILSELDSLFIYYRNMKEFDNLRQLYIDKIRAVLRKSFDILTESKNCIKWTTTTTSQFFSYSTLARISIFFSDNPLTFAQIVEYIEERFPWFDFSKDEVWLEGIEKSLQEKDYFSKIRKYAGRKNIHLDHWQISNYWDHQIGGNKEGSTFKQYDNFECKGLLSLNEYVKLVNSGIYLKKQKDKMGKPQIEEWQDNKLIRYVRANCLFKGKDRKEKYEGKGRRCKGCSKFLFKVEKKRREGTQSDFIAQINLNPTVDLQRVNIEDDSPIILKERSDVEIYHFQEELASLVTNTSSKYFRDTVQRVLDQKEIMSNNQSGALVKIKMEYCI